MSYENVKNFRARLKERAVYVMGEKCQCCGYNRCIQALEIILIEAGKILVKSLKNVFYYVPTVIEKHILE